MVVALGLGWIIFRHRNNQSKKIASTSLTSDDDPEMPGQEILETDGRVGLPEKDGKEGLVEKYGEKRVELQGTETSREVAGDMYRAELLASPVGHV